MIRTYSRAPVLVNRPEGVGDGDFLSLSKAIGRGWFAMMESWSPVNLLDFVSSLLVNMLY